MSRRAAALDTRQLPLFEAPPPMAPVAPMKPVAPVSAGPPAPSLNRPERPLPVVTPLAAAEPAMPDRAVSRHPRAEREIRLADHLVGYALKRSRRRSIGFIVGAEGLSVNAPKWVGLHDIDAALHEKAEWILRKLQEQQERAKRLQSARVDWRNGTTIPFLGESVIVLLDPRARGATLDTGATHASPRRATPDPTRESTPALPGVPRLTLHVGLPHGAAPEQIRDVVQSWLQRQARRIFEERCAFFAKQLGVRMSRLSLSSAQTRWGSASADGSIRLNWRLVHFAMSSIDYVVAHELAHLREMNHSPRFWDVVRSVLPDFEQARGTLRDGLLPLLD